MTFCKVFSQCISARESLLGGVSMHHALSLLLSINYMACHSLCEMHIDLSIDITSTFAGGDHKQTHDMTCDATAEICTLQAGNLKAPLLRGLQSPVGSGTQGRCGSAHSLLSCPAVGRALQAVPSTCCVYHHTLTTERTGPQIPACTGSMPTMATSSTWALLQVGLIHSHHAA